MTKKVSYGVRFDTDKTLLTMNDEAIGTIDSAEKAVSYMKQVKSMSVPDIKYGVGLGMLIASACMAIAGFAVTRLYPAQEQRCSE